MKWLNFLALGVCLLFAASVFAAEKDVMQPPDCDWAKDPRSLVFSTKGLEHFLPENPEPASITGFGELVGSWTWAEIGIPGSYGGAGISIDYPYLYLCNQSNDRIYIVDISTGIPDSILLWFSAPAFWPWGAGIDNECEFWTISHTTVTSYEYTTYPPAPSLTGNSFYAYQGSDWMADISDNIPYDSLYILRVGGNNHIYAFHEPSGTVGRDFGDSAWDYISQRALAYNNDDKTFFVGGWNSDRVWEISMVSGAPIPGRSFPSPSVAGAAYQDLAHSDSKGPYLWVQSNEFYDRLMKYHVPPFRPFKEDAIAYLKALKPTGDKKLDKKIDKIIRHIEKSLKEKLWIDKNHLDPKRGKKVFYEEKKAAKDLMKLTRKPNVPEEIKVVLSAVTLKLVDADSLLARTAIDDAIAAGGRKKEIEKAEKEMAKAEKDKSKARYDKAIDHYKHAWEHAQKAMKKHKKPNVLPSSLRG